MIGIPSLGLLLRFFGCGQNQLGFQIVFALALSLLHLQLLGERQLFVKRFLACATNKRKNTLTLAVTSICVPYPIAADRIFLADNWCPAR